MGARIEARARTYVRRRNRRRLRHLIGKHPHLRTSHSARLLWTAFYREDWNMLKWLLEHGADPNCQPSCQEDHNPLLLDAAGHGHAVAIRILSDFGADINAVNDDNENALGYAVTWSQIECIEELAAVGFDMNDTVDPWPLRTPLDTAELSDKKQVAVCLRTHGAKRFSELGWPAPWSEGDFVAIELTPQLFGLARVLPFPLITYYKQHMHSVPEPASIHTDPAFSVWTHWSAADRANWRRLGNRPLSAQERRIPFPYHRDRYTGQAWHIRAPEDCIEIDDQSCEASESAVFWSADEIEQRITDMAEERPNPRHEALRIENQPPPILEF